MSTILGNMLNFGGGGGSGGNYAFISVTYPSGSTCTATNGTTILTADDTSGAYIFGIPQPASTPEAWTISCTDGTNNSEKSINISAADQVETVSLKYVSTTLNNNSWATISEISIEGTGDTYWDVGDCKAVILNGSIGSYLTLSNTTLYVFILDFNHPINKSTADNNIIWGGFKTTLSNGIDVALCDSSYDTYKNDGTKIFNMNHKGNSSVPYNTNYGGWRGCDLRYDILGATSNPPSIYGNTTKSASNVGYNATAATISNPVANTLMAALPNDFRTILRLWNRYIDYAGNGSNNDSNCSTVTVDAITLLSEYEIFGTRTNANQYEQNHQKQMAYYSAGNSKIKYKHNATSTACIWWISSNPTAYQYGFCATNTDGSTTYKGSRYSYGIFPVFRT